jgi:hypothetical protein
MRFLACALLTLLSVLLLILWSRSRHCSDRIEWTSWSPAAERGWFVFSDRGRLGICWTRRSVTFADGQPPNRISRMCRFRSTPADAIEPPFYEAPLEDGLTKRGGWEHTLTMLGTVVCRWRYPTQSWAATYADDRVHHATQVTQGGFAHAPVWLTALLLAAYPLATYGRQSIAKRIRAQRRKRGQCRRCGYDLRASQSACPECGARCDPDREARFLDDGTRATNDHEAS